MKKSFVILLLALCCATLTAFTPISLVTFKSTLTFVQGQDTQSYVVVRELSPFSINKYETTYALWYEVRTQAEKLGYNFANPGQPGSSGRRAAIPNEETDTFTGCAGHDFLHPQRGFGTYFPASR